MSAFGYVAAESIEEAVGMLASRPEARVLAGGHNLLLQVNRTRIRGSLLVDLGKIATLRGIELRPEGLRIGAMTTIAELASSGLIKSEVPVLAAAAELVGDAQVRNRATLGGSLAAADPEGDLPAVMLALDAVLHLNGPNGWRKVAATELFEEPSTFSAARDEVIASIVVPTLPGNAGAAYLKFKHPARLYALCGVAAVVNVTDGKVVDVKVAATGAGDHPSRLEAVERALLNQPASREIVDEAAAHAAEGISFRGDFFASAEYRSHLIRVLTGRALKQALASADQK